MKHNPLFILFLLFCLPLISTLCKFLNPREEDGFRIITEGISDTESPFYLHLSGYPPDRNALPIGIFDSGTGGLTVLNSILELDEFNNLTHEPGSDGRADFISERFIYLADKANMPYGPYTELGKTDFFIELVLKDVIFLLGRQYYLSPGDPHPQEDKDPVKSIVIACNAATAYGLDTVKDAIDRWGLNIGVLGVIEAGARSAVEQLDADAGDPSVIGVLAAEATCYSGGYPLSIQECSSGLLPGLEVPVVQQAGIGLGGSIDGDRNYIDPAATGVRPDSLYFGPGLEHPVYPIDPDLWEEYNFVNGKGLLVETGPAGDTAVVQLNSVTNYARYMVTQLVNSVCREHPGHSLDVVILGCTHYPFVEDRIRDHFSYLKHYKGEYDSLIAENMVFIDPGKALAVELYRELADSGLLGKGNRSDSRFFVSVPNPLLKENKLNERGEFPYSWKFGREANMLLQYVKIVPFSEPWIDAGIRARLKEDIPTTYGIIYAD